MASQTATYSVKVEGNAKEAGLEGASALEKLRQTIQGSQAAMKAMSADLRQLRGGTDEIKGAKDKLKASIDAEKNAISSATLAIIQQGASYSKLSEGAKKTTSSHNELSKKIDELKEQFGTGAGRAAIMGGAIVALVATLYELAKSVVENVVEFAKMIVEVGLAERQANLLREAWTGSAESATNLGDQIALLGTKVPTSTEALSKMAGSVTKALNNTRVSGQGIVDTFNAVAQASAAMGDDVGKRLQDIIDRGKRFGRVQINPFELQGTGLQFQGIATSLAKQMHVSVDAAQQALFTGRVKIDDAAAAIRDAVEKRFGQVNAKMRLGEPLENLKKRFGELTRGIDFEPFLRAFEKLSSLLDTSTVSGAALKDLLETVAKVLGVEFEGHVDGIAEGFKYVLAEVINLTAAALETRNAFRQTFDTTDLFSFKNAIEATKLYVQKLGAFIVNMGWKMIGGQIVDGLIEGIESKIPSLKGVFGHMGDDVIKAFKSVLQISSPSKVFAEFGANTVEGYAGGVDDAAPMAQDAIQRMAPTAPVTDKGGSGARSGGIHVVVNNHAGNAEAAAKLAEPSFLAQMTKAITDALVGAGIPVQEEPQP